VFEAAYRLDGNELRRAFGASRSSPCPGCWSPRRSSRRPSRRNGAARQRGVPRRAIVSATDPVAVVEHDAPARRAAPPGDARRRGEPLQRRHGRPRVRDRGRGDRIPAAHARRQRPAVCGRRSWPASRSERSPVFLISRALRRRATTSSSSPSPSWLPTGRTLSLTSGTRRDHRQRRGGDRRRLVRAARGHQPTRPGRDRRRMGVPRLSCSPAPRSC